MSIRAGLLRERVSVYSVTATVASNGAKKMTETLKGTYWCRAITSVRTRDEEDGRVIYDPSIRFELRRQVPISDTDILEYRQNKYCITNIECVVTQDKQVVSVCRLEQ